MESDTHIRALLTDAIRFWERWRLLYNGILAGVVGYSLLPCLLGPGDQAWGIIALELFLCAVLANGNYLPHLS